MDFILDIFLGSMITFGLLLLGATPCGAVLFAIVSIGCTKKAAELTHQNDVKKSREARREEWNRILEGRG